MLTEFGVLGPVVVLVDGEVRSPGRRQERALLAVLLLAQGQVVPTSRLVGTLWGDRTPDNPAEVLKVYISRLRRALGQEHKLVAQGGGYRLDVPRAAVDAEQFAALTAEGRRRAAAGDLVTASGCLGRALALWRGLALADVAEFGGLGAEATRLGECRMAALEERLAVDLARGEHHGLVAELAALTQAHPLRERCWELRMLALYRAGRQTEALATYREVRSLLADRYGLEPGPALRRLEQQILRQDVSLRAPVLTPSARARSDRTAFVGREAELSALRPHLDAAVDGRGSLVLIGGEPGVGKTRLAEQVTAEAEERGAQVFAGHSYEAAGAAPWVAITEILAEAMARAPSPQAWREFLGAEAPEIARLLPRLRQLCPDIGDPMDLSPDSERRVLFDSVHEVVARSARQRPMVLLFDDLQWADEPTLLCLAHLAERVGQLPVLLLGTYRDNEVDVGRPLAATFEELRRHRLAHWLVLARMSELEVSALLRELAGRSVTAVVVGAIHSEADGNPFFTEEVYAYLAGDDRLLDATGGFRTPLVLAELDVPDSVRLIVGRRLRRLAPGTGHVLAAAAVAGRAFSVELLEAVEELEGVLEAVEEAERARVLLPAPDSSGEDRFIFAHEMIRQSVVADLSLTRRRRWHARLAGARERRYPDNLDEQAATIAHHLLEAGDTADPARACAYLARAGRFAQAGAAFEEAVNHLERALRLSEVLDPAARAQLLADLGTARACVGRSDEAVQAWDAALEEFTALGDTDAVGRVCLAGGYTMMFLARWADGMSMATRGLTALGDRVDPVRGRLLGMVAIPLSFAAGPHARIAEVLATQMEIAVALDNQDLLAEALLTQCAVHVARMEHRDLYPAAAHACTLFTAAGEWGRLSRTAGFWADGVAYMGRFVEAPGFVGEYLPVAERIGDPGPVLQLCRLRDKVQVWTTGKLELLEALGAADRAIVESNGMPWASGWSWLGWARFLRGDWDGALELFTQATHREPPTTIGYPFPLHFDCLAYRGDREAALALLEERCLPVPSDPDGWTLGACLGLVAAPEGLTVLGERNRAAALYPALLELFDRTGVICPGYEDGRLFERSAGIAAMAGRNWDLAESHFRSALDLACTLPHPIEAAHTRRWWGWMLLERETRGDGDAAAALLAAAAEDYQRMGMPRHRQMCSDGLGLHSYSG